MANAARDGGFSRTACLPPRRRLLATATWFVLSRGVLAAALPTIAATARVRILAALALLCAWLPFNLGIGGALRPSGGSKELPGAPSYRPDWPPASSAKPFAGPNWLAPQEGPPPPVQGHKP